MEVKIKKLHPDAVIPVYSKPGDAGKLHVSPDGLARIDFAGTDFESSYWLVQLQN